MNLLIKSAGQLLLTCFLFMGFVGCSSQKNVQQRIPDWVFNTASYPQSQQYLLAVGNGSTLDEATKDAFSSLAQIFRMTVEGEEQIISEVTESYNNSEYFTSGTTRLLNNVKTGTNQELINTTILEVQVGPDGTYYALAGMNRRESATIYSQEISGNILRLEELEKKADEENNTLHKLMLLKNLRLLAAANLNLSKQHNIIMSGASDLELASRRLSRIEDKFSETQQQATFYIHSENASATIVTSVTEVMQNLGFRAVGNSDEAVLEFSINFHVQKADMNRNDAEFAKWELGISVNDKQSGQSFKTYFTEGRDGANSYEDALKRADNSARKKLTTEFKNFMNQQLTASNP